MDASNSQIGFALNHIANFSAAMVQMNIHRFRDETLAQPRYADAKRLLRHGFKVYSQHDEDGIIQEIFRRIGTATRIVRRVRRRDRRRVQQREAPGRGLARALDRGERAILQGDRGELRRVPEGPAADAAAEPGDGGEHQRADRQEPACTGEIDLLSIDIDFNDYWVWKAIEAVDPRVVVIEYNAGLRPPLSLTVPYQPNRSGDGTNFFGASLEALVRLGAAKGYRIVGCNISGSNAFFVREDLCADHFVEPATAEEHYEPPRHFFSLLFAGPHAPKPGALRGGVMRPRPAEPPPCQDHDPRAYRPRRRGGRVAEGGGLLNRYTV